MLRALLSHLHRQPEDFTVFLGDYIDRGPDSREVVALLLQEHDRAPDKTILLWGNHEDMAAAFFGIPHPSGRDDLGEVWLHHGGKQTLESYGLTDTLFTYCPEPLVRLFGLLRTFWRCEIPEFSHVVFVHAGVPPAKTPEEVSAEELLWIREEFTNVIDESGRLVIFGHTPYCTVFQRIDKIGIDTGVGHGGALSALELPVTRLYKAYPSGGLSTFPILSREQMKW